MTLLAILYWIIIILSVIFYAGFHYAFVMPLAILALFIIIGLKVFRTPIK